VPSRPYVLATDRVSSNKSSHLTWCVTRALDLLQRCEPHHQPWHNTP
jgi:hypothetical protein